MGGARGTMGSDPIVFTIKAIQHLEYNAQTIGQQGLDGRTVGFILT